MYIGSQNQLKAYDQYLMDHGYSIYELVDKASDCLKKHFMDYDQIGLLVGPGNNGADALSLGIKLANEGKDVKLYYIGNHQKFSAGNQFYFDICENNNLTLIELSDEKLDDFLKDLSVLDVMGDGFFGFGLNSAPRGLYATVISMINSHFEGDVIAIDIPTGLNCNTGKPYANTLYASKTIALSALKEGFLNPDSSTFTGEVIVEELAIDNPFEQAGLVKYFDRSDARKMLKERKYDGYKNYYGVDLLVAGSTQYKGAALLATKGAVASGAGIVHLSSAKEVVDIMPLYLPEAISEIRPGSYSREMLKKFDAICIGPGLGLDMDAYHCFIDVIENSSCPLIIDADGLTILSNNLELLDRQQRPIILTPHLGEFKRLCDFSGDDQLTEVAINFAKEHHCILVLKGPHTLVTDGKHSYKNASGNKAMAVGGMGDTLAGMMTAFLGGHYQAIEAAILAVYIHGFTGDLIARDHYTVLPEELSKMIPHAMSLIGQK